MIIIAHRGNTEGPRPKKENMPTYIERALSSGYDSEIDVWCLNGHLYLGHDAPVYDICYEWIRGCSKRLWVHCKNREALKFFSELPDNPINYFWQNNDCYTITSHGDIWCHSEADPVPGSIAIDLNSDLICVSGLKGVCTDYALRLRSCNP